MQFFKFEALNTDENWAEGNENRHSRRERFRKIAMKTQQFNQKEGVYAFVSDAEDELVVMCAFCQKQVNIQELFESFLAQLEIEVNLPIITEITFAAARNLLSDASREGYICDDDGEVLENFELDKLVERFMRNLEFGENIIEKSPKRKVLRDAEEFLMRETLIPELQRIYAGKPNTRVKGHPVHYMIQTDERDVRNSVYRLLMQALYGKGRICSQRYTYLDFKPGDDFSTMLYDYLYNSCEGGTVIVRYLGQDDTETDHASCDRELIEQLCTMAKKYRKQVLTIFCLPRECTQSKAIFYEYLGNLTIVEMKEEPACGERAVEYLKELAKESQIRTDKKLFAKLETDKGYLTPDLIEIYDEWYNDKLKTSVFPQYKEMVTAKQEAVQAPPKGSAYDDLMEMIGLTEAKKVIKQALDYFKAQTVLKDLGMKADQPSMHMVFTGNPGTAKTSVARLFAQIMKENGILSRGKIVEVGRGDLVGKYVGWTAKIIQEKFREAKGGVLFIDEAYSLVDDRSGSYGDEAINTIVQEMENHRDDVVVIFAGYPDKMKGFLQKNPGLRSRIAFHVPFADYNADELCQISKLIAKQKGLEMTEGACEKLRTLFEGAVTHSDFGNGRYARNVIEKAKMAQATRLLSMDIDKLRKTDVVTLCEEDIEVPGCDKRPEKRPFGFCA